MKINIHILTVTFLLWPAVSASPAQTPKQPTNQSNSSPQTSEPTQSAAQKYFTDVELQNQNGKTVRFYSDLMKGHTVVIIPFFTSCTAVCPPMNSTMRRIQQSLGDRVGKDIYLISMTVDPTTDTPEKLLQYAERFHAGPGWFFITGKKENLEVALKKLGHNVVDRNAHTTIMIIGNVTTGLWKKAHGLAKPEELVKIIAEVADDKGETK